MAKVDPQTWFARVAVMMSEIDYELVEWRKELLLNKIQRPIIKES